MLLMPRLDWHSKNYFHIKNISNLKKWQISYDLSNILRTLWLWFVVCIGMNLYIKKLKFCKIFINLWDLKQFHEFLENIQSINKKNKKKTKFIKRKIKLKLYFQSLITITCSYTFFYTKIHHFPLPWIHR